jgi:hypothetical protein
MGDRLQAVNKDRSASWEMAEEVIGGQRCSCRATPGSWSAPVGAAMPATTSTISATLAPPLLCVNKNLYLSLPVLRG